MAPPPTLYLVLSLALFYQLSVLAEAVLWLFNLCLLLICTLILPPLYTLLWHLNLNLWSVYCLAQSIISKERRKPLRGFENSGTEIPRGILNTLPEEEQQDFDVAWIQNTEYTADKQRPWTKLGIWPTTAEKKDGDKIAGTVKMKTHV